MTIQTYLFSILCYLKVLNSHYSHKPTLGYIYQQWTPGGQRFQSSITITQPYISKLPQKQGQSDATQTRFLFLLRARFLKRKFVGL
ncbi:hypothetical protein AYI68_g2027 [Smittium mucronatum]|uniref:Uncharacterized protein n=1 Tax=Smittium mucronatum TaxID=133383 RepID=A0A1R0H3V1_9FUNG|nr:hypothetical protein AYI68_g2027 [Smittium mucronatum]